MNELLDCPIRIDGMICKSPVGTPATRRHNKGLDASFPI